MNQYRLSTEVPPALAGMRALDQWVVYRREPLANGKTNKIPIDPRTQRPVDPLNPQLWMTAEHAGGWAKHLQGLNHDVGIGFSFSNHDPFCFFDLDQCFDSNGQLAPDALHVLQRFPGAAVERSCSWRGLHLFGRCAPGIDHACKNAEHNWELYTTGRFVALGYNATGSCDTDVTIGIQTLVSEYFTPIVGTRSEDWTTEPRPEYAGNWTDLELINRALSATPSAAEAFGDRASFADLWNANDSKLERAFPDPQRAYNASSADMALAGRLAFWTGGNCERIQHLMEQGECALRREKWDRVKYLRDTIMKAVSGTEDVYTGGRIGSAGKALRPPRRPTKSD